MHKDSTPLDIGKGVGISNTPKNKKKSNTKQLPPEVDGEMPDPNSIKTGKLDVDPVKDRLEEGRIGGGGKQEVVLDGGLEISPASASSMTSSMDITVNKVDSFSYLNESTKNIAPALPNTSDGGWFDSMSSKVLTLTSLASMGLAGIAMGGGRSSTGASSSPQSTSVVSGSVIAGPATGGLMVTIYAADGRTVLGFGQVESNGTFSIKLSVNYAGAILAKVEDINGSQANYRSEIDGKLISLASPLYAVSVLSSSAPLQINITPLTTIAARNAGSMDGGTIDIATVETANLAVAKAFGLGAVDLTSATPVTTLETGTNSYGVVLAAIEGAGSLSTVITTLASAVKTKSDGISSLSADGVMLLQQGAAVVEQKGIGNTGDLVTKVTKLTASLAPSVVIGTVATDDKINASEKTAGVTVSGTTTAENGQTITVVWGTATKTAIVASGAWSVSFASTDIPADAASSTITASVSDAAGNLASAAKAVVIDAAISSVDQLLGNIRSIETFSDPNNPGQVVGGLVKNGLPSAVLTYATDAKSSGTLSLAAYPGDERATPGAYQVDVVYLNNTMGVMGSGSTTNVAYNDNSGKQIQLSKDSLSRYLGITVDANGRITEISQAAFAVFTKNMSAADITNFNKNSNALIGQQIDNFKYEQFSAYLGGRVEQDLTYGSDSLAADKRTAPDSVLAMGTLMQSDLSKYSMVSQYLAALKNNANNASNFGANGFANIEGLFGATLKMVSSSSAFGVVAGDTFSAEFNSGFLMGYGYVRGFYELRSILVEMWGAKSAPGSTQSIVFPDKTVHITYIVADNTFAFDGTPINVNNTYPSGFHYGALLSRDDPLPDVSYSAWGISNLSGYTGLGYTSNLVEVTQSDSGTLVSNSGTSANYKVTYSGLSNSKTIVINGDDGYSLAPDTTTSTGNHIDLTTIPASGGVAFPSITSFTQLASDAVGTKLYYRYWGATDFVYLDANGYVALPSGQQFDVIYTTGATAADRLANAKATWNGAAWILGTVTNKDYLGTIDSGDFIYTGGAAAGTGVIDASLSMGALSIDVDLSIGMIKFGAGNTIIQDSNTTTTTYVMKSGAGASQNLTIDGFDLTDTVVDKIDLRNVTGLVQSSLSVAVLNSFNTHSDDAGSSTAKYYQNYHNTLEASYTDLGGVHKLQLGVLSDAALNQALVNNSIFLV